MNDRYRMVTETGSEQIVSHTLLTVDEVPLMLDAEEMLHRSCGWHVERFGAMLRLTKDESVRWVWVRSRPVMDDTL